MLLHSSKVRPLYSPNSYEYQNSIIISFESPAQRRKKRKCKTIFAYLASTVLSILFVCVIGLAFILI